MAVKHPIFSIHYLLLIIAINLVALGGNRFVVEAGRFLGGWEGEHDHPSSSDDYYSTFNWKEPVSSQLIEQDHVENVHVVRDDEALRLGGVGDPTILYRNGIITEVSVRDPKVDRITNVPQHISDASPDLGRGFSVSVHLSSGEDHLTTSSRQFEELLRPKQQRNTNTKQISRTDSRRRRRPIFKKAAHLASHQSPLSFLPNHSNVTAEDESSSRPSPQTFSSDLQHSDRPASSSASLSEQPFLFGVPLSALSTFNSHAGSSRDQAPLAFISENGDRFYKTIDSSMVGIRDAHIQMRSKLAETAAVPPAFGSQYGQSADHSDVTMRLTNGSLLCDGVKWNVVQSVYDCCGNSIYRKATEHCKRPENIIGHIAQYRATSFVTTEATEIMTTWAPMQLIVCGSHRYNIPSDDVDFYACCNDEIYFWPKESCDNGKVESGSYLETTTNQSPIKPTYALLICEDVANWINARDRRYFGCCGALPIDIRFEVCTPRMMARMKYQQRQGIANTSNEACPSGYICCSGFEPVANETNELQCCGLLGPQPTGTFCPQ